MKKVTALLVLSIAFLGSLQLNAVIVGDYQNHMDLREFFPSVDASVGCPNIQPQTSDIQVTKQENLLSVTVNGNRSGGFYMNAIMSKKIQFVDDSIYVFSGAFRKPLSAENEQLDINLQLVENYTEYHAEILWDLNPYNVLYQKVWTRGQDLNKPMILFDLKDDSNWHSFKLVARYASNPKRRVMESITVDGMTRRLNLPMGTLPKAWKSSFFTMLETTNRYPVCGSVLAFEGKSEWKNIMLERKPYP